MNINCNQFPLAARFFGLALQNSPLFWRMHPAQHFSLRQSVGEVPLDQLTLDAVDPFHGIPYQIDDECDPGTIQLVCGEDVICEMQQIAIPCGFPSLDKWPIAPEGK